MNLSLLYQTCDGTIWCIYYIWPNPIWWLDHLVLTWGWARDHLIFPVEEGHEQAEPASHHTLFLGNGRSNLCHSMATPHQLHPIPWPLLYPRLTSHERERETEIMKTNKGGQGRRRREGRITLATPLSAVPLRKRGSQERGTSKERREDSLGCWSYALVVGN